MKIKNVLKHPPAVSILSTLAVPLILFVVSKIFGWFEFLDVINALKAVLAFEVPIWAILPMLLLLVAVYLLLKKRPPSYTEDDFGKLHLWRWGWEKQEGKWEIINLAPYCSKCDMPKIGSCAPYRGGPDSFYCLDCEVFCDYYDPKIIKTKILDNAQRGKTKKTN